MRGAKGMRENDTTSANREILGKCFHRETFYKTTKDGKFLKEEIYLEHSTIVASVFAKADLKVNQLRKILRQIQTITNDVKYETIVFPEAVIRIDKLYNFILYQSKRRVDNSAVIPTVVKDFFEGHFELMKSSKKELIGFSEYLLSIYCKFDNGRG